MLRVKFRARHHSPTPRTGALLVTQRVRPCCEARWVMAWRWRAALDVREPAVGDRIQREPDDAWTDDYGEGMRFWCIVV